MVKHEGMKPVTDDMMQHMIKEGYIIVADNQDSLLKQQGEILYEFGKIPPETDPEARELFFGWYRQASNYQLIDGAVYRNKRPHKPRKGRK